MAERSYTLPSSAMTGSTGSEKVMGQRNSFMASSVALLCRRSCAVSSSRAAERPRLGGILRRWEVATACEGIALSLAIQVHDRGSTQ
eukprot:jgi/Chrpa1/19357/Chrysochromulina_OHIO_Genome00020525-RA